MSTTRDRIIETSAELFRRQGYSATGVKQIVTAAQAPFGSLYHFFPGGKEELGAAAVRTSGALYAQLIPAVFDPAPDIVTGVRTFFAAAAEHLRETDYEDACPIATVALEVASTSETMRQACADVFESWIRAGAERFERAGVDAATARELTIAMLTALEGAFILARAGRETEPLRVAGELAAERVERALANPARVVGPAADVEPTTPADVEPTAPSESVAPNAQPTTPADVEPTAPSESVAPNAQPTAERPQPTAERPPTAARVRPRLRARWPDREDGQSPGPASP